MNVRENTRREIETKINGMGDYVKMDYLLSCLKKQTDFDTKRFVLLTLGGLYEKRNMHLDAGKMFHTAAPINPSDKGKIDDYVKAAEFFLKAGTFDKADMAFEKAIALGNKEEQWDVKQRKINLYKDCAKNYLQKDKRHNALLAYEKLLTLPITEKEKKGAQEELLGLYDKLGKVKEYFKLKKSLSKN